MQFGTSVRTVFFFFLFRIGMYGCVLPGFWCTLLVGIHFLFQKIVIIYTFMQFFVPHSLSDVAPVLLDSRWWWRWWCNSSSNTQDLVASCSSISMDVKWGILIFSQFLFYFFDHSLANICTSLALMFYLCSFWEDLIPKFIRLAAFSYFQYF